MRHRQCSPARDAQRRIKNKKGTLRPKVLDRGAVAPKKGRQDTALWRRHGTEKTARKHFAPGVCRCVQKAR